MAAKVKMGQVLIWLGGTLFVVYLNTFVVWLWPESSVWALGVVVVLGVVFVIYVYRTTQKAVPPDGEGWAVEQHSVSCEG